MMPVERFLSDLLTVAVSALGGAWAGARLAFNYDAKRDARREQLQNLAAGRRTLYCLSDQIQWLGIMRRNLELDRWEKDLKERKDRSTAWVEIPVAMAAARPPLINIESLGFLFESASPNVPNVVWRAQREFSGYAEILDLRNDFHLNTFQPAVAMALGTEGINRPFPETLSIIVARLNPAIIGRLQNNARDLILGYRPTLKAAVAGFISLREAMNKMSWAPGTKLIDFRWPEAMEATIREIEEELKRDAE